MSELKTTTAPSMKSAAPDMSFLTKDNPHPRPAPAKRPAGGVIEFEGDPVLSISDLHVTFASEAGPVRAVRGLNYNLYRGECLGIVGESGSGKSVTSMAIMGLLSSNASISGSIKFNGEELLTKTDAQMSKIRGKKISMIFQDPLNALTPVFTIGEQMAEALKIHNPSMTKQQIQQRSIEILESVGITHGVNALKAYPHQFSGGMCQRVVIGMAIANDPDIIIADEPTTALDVTIQAQILEVLRKAQQETGASLLFITHDLGVIAGFADNILVMYAGRAVEKGSADEIFYHPAAPYTMGLLGAIPRIDRPRNQRLVPIPGAPVNLVDLPEGCPFAPRCFLPFDVPNDKEPELTPIPGHPHHEVACHLASIVREKHLTAEEIFKAKPAPPSIFGDTPIEEREQVLQVKGLVKNFPSFSGGFVRRKTGIIQAVNHVSLDVRQGETVALVGESGSGKTTTLLEIMSLKPPQSGSIEILGTPVTKDLSRAKKNSLHRDMQFVFQDPMSSIDPRLPVYDILAEPMRVLKMTKQQINKRVYELLRLVELNPDQADRFPTQFSGGQRQRIAIARALAVNPKLILLDEPVSALDVSIQAGILNLLEDLQRKFGIAYLLVAHNLSVINHIADRIYVMYHGQIVEAGQTEDIFNNPIHPYTKSLLSAMPVPDPEYERHHYPIIFKDTDTSAGDKDSHSPLFLSNKDIRKGIKSQPVELIVKGPRNHLVASNYLEEEKYLISTAPEGSENITFEEWQKERRG